MDEWSPAHEDSALRAFVAAVERAHRSSACRTVALRWGLPGLVCAVLLLWWSALFAGAVFAVAVLATALAVQAADTNAARRDGVLDLRAQARRLGDDLLTWDEVVDDPRGRAAMVAWLTADLDAQVATQSQQPRRLLGGIRLGPVRYLLPVVVVLLLLWLLVPTIAVPGARGGGGGGSSGGPALAGPLPTRAPGGGASNEPPPPPPPEPEPKPQPNEPPPPEPPAPILDLPTLPSFVVPDFVGDGPTRRAQAERALVAAGGADATAAAAAAAAAGGADRAPPPAAAEFARAQERALRSRTVPDGERAIVRRFFELLQQEAK